MKRPKPKLRWRTMKAWGGFFNGEPELVFWKTKEKAAEEGYGNDPRIPIGPVQIRWQERSKERK